MNRQIRVKKFIGTVKCIATCDIIEINPWKREIRLLGNTYLAGAPVVTTISVILAIKSRVMTFWYRFARVFVKNGHWKSVITPR